MFNHNLLLAGLIAIFACPLSAQDAPMKYVKIPKEDLEMKVYEPDTAASALVLCDYGKLTFDFPDGRPQVKLEKHKRIKILKRAGFDQGDIFIPYYKTGNIRSLKAQVVAPDGKETDVLKKDIFDEKVNDNFLRIRFAFPNLSEGCVIEYKYEYILPYIFELPEWYFQEDIPVRWSEYRLEIPEFYQYVTFKQGQRLDIVESGRKEQGIALSDPAGRHRSLFTGFRVLRLAGKNMPGLKKEAYITTMDDYYTRIRFQLESIRFPDEPAEPVMSNWTKAAEKLLADEDFGGRIDRKQDYEKLLAEAKKQLTGITDRDARIRALYKFVNSSFDREDGTRIYTLKKFDDLYEKKSARGSEMNLMLVALLRASGIAADPVLVSTRDHGQTIQEYPIIDQFNHVLAMVEQPEGKAPLLLDAGNAFRPAGLVAINSLSRGGWVVHRTNPRWIVIEPAAANETYFGKFKIDEAGNLGGAIEVVEEGYSAMGRREGLSKKTGKEYWETELRERHPDVVADSVVVENKDEELFSSQIKEHFNCSLPGYAQVSGDFIYLTPMFYSSFFESPFKVEKRNSPVDIPCPLKERVIVELTVPSGYKVESLPEPARMALPGDGGRFQFTVAHEGDKIRVNCMLQVTQLHYETEQYDGLRTFFGMAAEKFGEQVVLKKI